MSTYCCLSVRFLQPLYHGRGEGGAPEWPPSPLRVFQALACAAAARSNERLRLQQAAPALRWLERQTSPMIVAPTGNQAAKSYRLYVPDNTGDRVAASWVRGGSLAVADLRTEKDVQPTYLDGDTVHYLFPIADSGAELAHHGEALMHAARSITHLGWGIDMVAASATLIGEKEAAALPGVRWLPTQIGNGAALRIPCDGTLDDLMRKHEAFLNRLGRDARGNESFNPVPALSAYRVIGYRLASDPPPRPFAAFKLLTPDAGDYRPFETTRYATVVAGMLRCALAKLAYRQRPFDWDDAHIARVVLGHDQNGKAIRLDPSEPRFSYLSLPSIERRGTDSPAHHVGSIRRVMVAGTPGMEREIQWVRQALSGAELIREGDERCAAIVSLVPTSDWVVRQYCQPSETWTTVTPVVLPGYDSRNGRKAERLLRKALRQAGIADELAQSAELDWRGVGYLPGVDLASRYRRPRNIGEAPVCHVTIRWHDAQRMPLRLAGPFAIGSGRFRGLGVFVGRPNG